MLTPSEQAHAARLASGGCTPDEIAARLDRPVTDVKRALKKAAK
jgi:DNA-directed RNA polymerase specialized sigma24 family protein